METVMVDQAMFDRAHRDFCFSAKEEGQTELICGCYYFYASEIATLRLLKAHRLCKAAKQGYSENLKTFYFRIETQLGGDFSS